MPKVISIPQTLKPSNLAAATFVQMPKVISILCCAPFASHLQTNADHDVYFLSHKHTGAEAKSLEDVDKRCRTITCHVKSQYATSAQNDPKDQNQVYVRQKARSADSFRWVVVIKDAVSDPDPHDLRLQRDCSSFWTSSVPHVLPYIPLT